MNKDQRKVLDEVYKALEEAQQVCGDMAYEERDKFGNLSEGLQQSERGELLEQAADALETAEQSLGDVLSSLDEVMSL
jgi:ABC-type transporter Mla subunit MlaD